jgi:hypothetical protein
MGFTPADPSSLATFVLIVLAVLGSIYGGARFADRETGRSTAPKFAVAAFVWLAILSLLVGSGFIEDSPYPRLILFIGLSNFAVLILSLSPFGGHLASTLPFSALVVFQSFRIPLELILHRWAGDGVIPETMTWTGMNFDIITGFIALAVYPLVDKNPKLAWIPNVIGFGLLVNVMRVAMFSSPLPGGWDVHPPLLLAFHLPYAWIIPVCVGGALFGHIVLTRALLGHRNLRT